MRKSAFLASLAAGTLLAACESVPAFDPANYYPVARYHDEPLPTDTAFWDIRLKSPESEE